MSGTRADERKAREEVTWPWVIHDCPWPERNGLRARPAPRLGDHYPWTTTPKTEVVVIVEHDPLTSAHTGWSCVMPKAHLVDSIGEPQYERRREVARDALAAIYSGAGMLEADALIDQLDTLGARIEVQP